VTDQYQLSKIEIVDTLSSMIRLIQVCIITVLLTTSVSAQTFSPSNIKIVWRDSNDIPYMLFKNVQKAFPNAIFMTNGSRDTKSHHPIGLYIEKGKKLSNPQPILNTKASTELQPLGVFVISKGKAFISKVLNASAYKDADYALQSNPILVWDGAINKQLPKGKIIMRNGVGVKRDGSVYFACLQMGYRDFAQHFIDQDCISAIQLSDQKAETWQKDSKPSYSRYATIFVVE
jgi:uncharacterized protein YigE (DUF2233 family)